MAIGNALGWVFGRGPRLWHWPHRRRESGSRPGPIQGYSPKYRPALSSLLLASIASLISGLGAVRDAGADEVRLNGRTFTPRDGFTIELAAGPPLVDRPIVAAFDERGGSTSPTRPARTIGWTSSSPRGRIRIVRLEDSDGDGRLDCRTVFADRMMFPEGAMLFDGSLYEPIRM